MAKPTRTTRAAIVATDPRPGDPRPHSADVAVVKDEGPHKIRYMEENGEIVTPTFNSAADANHFIHRLKSRGVHYEYRNDEEANEVEQADEEQAAEE